LGRWSIKSAPVKISINECENHSISDRIAIIHAGNGENIPLPVSTSLDDTLKRIKDWPLITNANPTIWVSHRPLADGPNCRGMVDRYPVCEVIRVLVLNTVPITSWLSILQASESLGIAMAYRWKRDLIVLHKVIGPIEEWWMSIRRSSYGVEHWPHPSHGSQSW
jgi:hypothetical protein